MTLLFRVFTHTSGDESITERIVAAENAQDAQVHALKNVKAQNLGKGLTAQAESQRNTTILSVKECGKNGVLCTGRMPLTSLSAITGAMNLGQPTQADRDLRADVVRLAGLPEGSDTEEALLILEAMGQQVAQPGLPM